MTCAAGVDASGGGMTGDEFAWAICHREGDRILADLVATRGRQGRQPIDLDGAVAACAQDLAWYGVYHVLADRYAGAWPAEAFQRHGIRYVPTGQPKSELYLALLPLITMGRLELPPDPELLRQAKLLERRHGAQGRDMVDHPVGGHDDRINAVALAVAVLPTLRSADLPILVGGQSAVAREAAERQYGPVLESWEQRSIARHAALEAGPGGARRRGLII